MSRSSRKRGLSKSSGSALKHFQAPGASVEYSLDDSLAYQLRLTYKSFTQRLQPLLNVYEVPLGMWYFLRALWDEDGLTQREISERVGLVAPTTVEQLRNMEKRGLIERHRSVHDRRKIHVHLTSKGKALKAQLLPFAPYVNNVAVQGLSAGEIGFLRLVLTRIQKNLAQASAAKASPASPERATRRSAGRRAA